MKESGRSLVKISICIRVARIFLRKNRRRKRYKTKSLSRQSMCIRLLQQNLLLPLLYPENRNPA